MSTLWSLLSDWLMWAIGGLAVIVAPAAGVVKRNHDRSVSNRRALYGDDDDPNTEGVLQIAAETRTNVQELEARMDRQHRELKAILEDKT